MRDEKLKPLAKQQTISKETYQSWKLKTRGAHCRWLNENENGRHTTWGSEEPEISDIKHNGNAK